MDYLTPISYHHNTKHHCYWLYQCNCGNERVIRKDSVSSGSTKSCGCINRRKEGFYFPKEYESWIGMKKRCLNINNHAYPSYGGRGIKICEEWIKDFAHFLADMGPCPTNKTSIDRINNEGNYEPSNCRWATHREQARNRKSNRYVSCYGDTMLMSDFADKYGILKTTVSEAVKNGRSLESVVERKLRGICH
jgi:hypothetical protein